MSKYKYAKTSSSMKQARMMYMYGAPAARIVSMIGARRFKQMTQQYFDSACWPHEL